VGGGRCCLGASWPEPMLSWPEDDGEDDGEAVSDG
jgi:hypothetical protein